MRRKQLARFFAAVRATGAGAWRAWYRFLCCEDDELAEVMERQNSKPRTTTAVVNDLIQRRVHSTVEVLGFLSLWRLWLPPLLRRR